MNDIRYLLSIKELYDSPNKQVLIDAAYGKLDRERLQKAKDITNEKKRAESIGAGLLLQLGVQRLNRMSANDDAGGVVSEEANGSGVAATLNVADSPVQLLTVSEVLAKLGEPVDIEYSYGENGKPQFCNCPWHFNLSHSGEYVFCVFSKQEIGVDIQYKRTFYSERILRRFFTEEEQELWNACTTSEEKETFFYRMWIKKESYGKLTGEGIIKAVSVNVTEADAIAKLGVFFEDYEILDNYQITVCKHTGEKE